ncbi:MAG: hypothetical protein IRZ16_06505 [Myxococcaceae bacterium]|nr:hypothetical protein [Myxococcaceae bacterium]
MTKTLITAAATVLMLACGGMPDDAGAVDGAIIGQAAPASGSAAASDASSGEELKSKKSDSTRDTTQTQLKVKKKPVAGQGGTGSSGPDPGTATTYATRTTDVVEPGIAPTWKTSFAIAETWSVEIATDVPASSAGHHVLDVYVYSPSGATYEAFTVRFAAGAPAGADEIEAEDLGTGYRVWVSLPVIGTFIDSYHLAGGWKADSWIDGAGPRSSAEFQLQ